MIRYVVNKFKYSVKTVSISQDVKSFNFTKYLFSWIRTNFRIMIITGSDKKMGVGEGLWGGWAMYKQIYDSNKINYLTVDNTGNKIPERSVNYCSPHGPTIIFFI